MPKQGYKFDDANQVFEIINENQVLSKSDMKVQLAAFREVRAFDDATRTKLALGAPGFFIQQGQFQSLADLDTHLDDEIKRLGNMLDYEFYNRAPLTINGVASHGYMVPEAVESVSDDNGSDIAANAIDVVGGDPWAAEPSTFWQSEITGTREIVFRLRGDYDVKVEGIRLRVNASDTRAALQDVTIKAASNINRIDDPGNVMTPAPVAFVNTGKANVEYIFPGGPKFNARYVKLEFSTSLHPPTFNEVRIRVFEARVGVINFED